MNGITSEPLAATLGRDSVDADTDTVAAVDLGSNSFHLLVARVRGGHLVPTERVKEKVQLARGQRDGVLTADAVARGLAVAGRFAQRLRGVPSDHVVVAGTSALREATNPEAFVPDATRMFGRSVRVLSGREEAELIFLGVSHALADDSGNWLVIDVGGGSTELCYGRPFTPDRVASVRLGCVALTDAWFGEAGSTPGAYRAAREAALELLHAASTQFGGLRTGRVIGTSGTVESVQNVLNANGFTAGPITRAAISELEDAILSRRWMAESGVPGLAPERVDIFPAGVAAVSALFEALDLEKMEFVDATLLNGLLYDLVGRRSAEDVRELAVAQWRRQFDVDPAHVARVKATAQRLLDEASGAWPLDDEPCRRLLRWACDLHEIGLAVSFRHPNRHGAYLIENGDLAGFSAEDRRALALLVRAHRGGFPHFAFAPFDERQARQLRHLTILLRLAVVLEHSRADADSPRPTLVVSDTTMALSLPAGWLADHPLSARELEVERDRLADVGVRLTIDARG